MQDFRHFFHFSFFPRSSSLPPAGRPVSRPAGVLSSLPETQKCRVNLHNPVRNFPTVFASFHIYTSSFRPLSIGHFVSLQGFSISAPLPNTPAPLLNASVSRLPSRRQCRSAVSRTAGALNRRTRLAGAPSRRPGKIPLTPLRRPAKGRAAQGRGHLKGGDASPPLQFIRISAGSRRRRPGW